MDRQPWQDIKCDIPVPLNRAVVEDAVFPRLNAIETSLPHPNPTKAFWTHGTPNCNPLAREGSTSAIPNDVDVCIIGSGMTGVSCAYNLTTILRERDNAKTVNVVILEARDFCSGATGRNGGHLCPTIFGGMHRLSETYGPEEAKKNPAYEHHTVDAMLQLIQDNEWQSDVDLVEGGRMHILYSNEELDKVERNLEAAEKAGVPEVKLAKRLTADETKAKYGTNFPALFIPSYNFWPLKFVTKLYELTTIWGSTKSADVKVSLHTHTPVQKVSRSPTSARRFEVETPRGTIHADYVVHATNAYVSHLVPHLAGPEGVVPTRGQVIAARSSVSAEWLWRCAWVANDQYEYWFPRPCPPAENPLVILGGGREVGPNFEIGIEDDSVLNDQVSKVLREFLPAAFPTQFEEGMEPEMEWSGIMGFTQNQDPKIGLGPRYEGEYIAVGYSGHGMPRAFAGGEVVAQMIAADMRQVKWERPAWLPCWYLTPQSTANPLE